MRYHFGNERHELYLMKILVTDDVRYFLGNTFLAVGQGIQILEIGHGGHKVHGFQGKGHLLGVWYSTPAEKYPVRLGPHAHAVGKSAVNIKMTAFIFSSIFSPYSAV